VGLHHSRAQLRVSTCLVRPMMNVRPRFTLGSLSNFGRAWNILTVPDIRTDADASCRGRDQRPADGEAAAITCSLVDYRKKRGEPMIAMSALPPSGAARRAFPQQAVGER